MKPAGLRHFCRCASMGLALILVSGCARLQRERLHPLFRVTDWEVQEAVKQAATVRLGRDREANLRTLYGSLGQRVHQQVGRGVTVEEVLLCLPTDFLRAQAALAMGRGDLAMQQAAQNALSQVGRSIRFVAFLSLTPDLDPAQVQFFMEDGRGNRFSPLRAVKPELLREVTSAFTGKTTRYYDFALDFPVSGRGRLPPIDAEVKQLILIVAEGGQELRLAFALPIPQRKEVNL